MEVWWSEVRLEGGKARAQHLLGAGVDGLLPGGVVGYLLDHIPVDVHQRSLERRRGQSSLMKTSSDLVFVLVYTYTVEPLYCGHLGDLVKCPV